MSDHCESAAELLRAITDGVGLQLRIAVQEKSDGCMLQIEGADSDLLLSEGGEVLDGLQHLLNQVLARSLPKGWRIALDVNQFRATREAELQAMASLAAERVRTSGSPFIFGPMNSNERRVIHLALAETPDLQTESVGEGANRRLRVLLKK